MMPIQNPQQTSRPQPQQLNMTPIQNPQHISQPQHSKPTTTFTVTTTVTATMRTTFRRSTISLVTPPPFPGTTAATVWWEMSTKETAGVITRRPCRPCKRLKDEVLNLRRQLAAYGMENGILAIKVFLTSADS